MTKYTVIIAATLGLVGGTAFAGSHMANEKTIVEIAAGAPEFSTLVTAVQAAGLAETLSGDGPFTVFAPTNAAFEALPEGTVSGLLDPAAKEQLTQVLTCHVVGAEVMSEALVEMMGDDAMATVETLGGCMIEAKLDGDTVTLTDENGGVSTVTAADLKASNGVIHVIDAVILPQM